MPESYADVGIGADSGTVTLETIDVGDAGWVKVTFDLPFFVGHAEGVIVAPLCAPGG